MSERSASGGERRDRGSTHPTSLELFEVRMADLSRSAAASPGQAYEHCCASGGMLVAACCHMRGLALVVLVGCAQPDRSSLANLVDAELEIKPRNIRTTGADDPFAHPSDSTSDIEVVITTPDCASLAEDAVATFEGVELSISDAFVDDCHLCQPVTIQGSLPASAFVGQPSHFRLADSSGAWTAEFPGLDGAIETSSLVAGKTATFSWPAMPYVDEFIVSMIYGPDSETLLLTSPDARVRFANATALVDIPSYVTGPASIDFGIGGTFAFETARTGTASCDGPAHCSIGLYVTTEAFGLPVAQ
jgi:hypothetical protein